MAITRNRSRIKEHQLISMLELANEQRLIRLASIRTAIMGTYIFPEQQLILEKESVLSLLRVFDNTILEVKQQQVNLQQVKNNLSSLGENIVLNVEETA